ncbi:acetylornithine deacetylase [Cribrihabitans neustonicus]|uniref:acetylornithine deacetylase n=1 Tax=Cribrihabitans neustonicus TaxID=1429085 RepID=UPI003B59DE2D
MTPLETATALLARLVSFPTVSMSSNLELIGFVQSYLSDHGVTCTLLPNADGSKAGLIATIGPSVPGGVVLSGHTDVVPAEGQDWSADPWTLRSEGGRLLGRGACDMKGFCAAVLAMVPQFQAADLKRPVHIVFSYDEEIGCFGVQPLIAHMAGNLPPPEAVIVGEPTGMSIVNGHKGTWSLMTRVTGYEVHSSICHTGVSAVMAAARLVCWLEDRMLENAQRAKTAGQGSGFSPPYTTLHAGRIKGGTSGNTTAGYCSFPADIRVMPEEDMDRWLSRYLDRTNSLQAELQKIRSEAGITVEVKARVAGLAPEKDGAAEALVQELAGGCAVSQAGFGSEAGLFQEAGYSTVICGPGAMAQAHQPGEYLEAAQLQACLSFLGALPRRLAA